MYLSTYIHIGKKKTKKINGGEKRESMIFLEYGIVDALNIKKEYIGMHMRGGDKANEVKLSDYHTYEKFVNKLKSTHGFSGNELQQNKSKEYSKKLSLKSKNCQRISNKGVYFYMGGNDDDGIDKLISSSYPYNR